MIQKILSLTPNYWVNGLSPSEYYDGGKALYEAKGIDLFKYPGRLAVGYGSRRIGTSTVNTEISAFVNQPTSNYLYGLGQTKLYKIGIISDSVTVLHSTTQAGFDLEIYKNNLVYSQQTQIGKYNWSTFSDTAIGGTSFLSTAIHPMKEGADGNLYIGNLNKLAKWDGTIGNSAKLTFDSGYTVTSLANDGFYLVLGAVTSGTNTSAKKCYIMFWDMVSEQVSRKYELPGATTIYNITEKDGYIIAFCENRTFVCQFDSPPKELIKNGSGRYSFGKNYGRISLAYNGLTIFPTDLYGTIGAYGSTENGLPEVFSNPWTVGESEGDISAMDESYGRLYVATDTPRLLRIDSGGGNLTGVTAKTPLIDLGRDWKIHFIKIMTEPLASGDSISVTLHSSSSGTALSTGTFTHTADGAKTKKILPVDGKIINQAQLQITIEAGNPKIKSVEIFGEPMAELS